MSIITIPAAGKLTASDNAILRYNITLNGAIRKKLRKYFRILAKSDIFLECLSDGHAYKDFFFLGDQPYEVAYRDCGRDQLENAEAPVDLLLSLRQAYDSNVRICLVTPLTPELLNHMGNCAAVDWLEPL